MKKQLLLLTGLCGVFLVGFQSCNRGYGADTTLYSFKLTQPDGTTPQSGYALIYEKHLDSTTGIASLRIPISDTLRWEDDEILWTDVNECPKHSLTIGCFSPEKLTNDALRYEWYSLDSGTPEIELSFIQSRSVRITVRSFNQNQTPSHAWGMLISPLKDVMEPLDDTSNARTQFNDISFAEGNITSLLAQIEFDEFSTLYAHLFRLYNGEWIPNGFYALALNENVDKFEFYTNYTMSCCE
jgi:hypothetical protein